LLHSIPHKVSDALRAENSVHDRNAASLTTEWLRAHFPTAGDFVRAYAESAEGLQLIEALEPVRLGADVLDIGAGYGRTAILLASLGYRVSAAEPARGLCEHLDRAARLYGLEVPVYHVSGEHLDRLRAGAFDVCMFNASLHHCDEPVRALKNCHRLLRPGGQVLLFNEPILQVFRSKRWFQQQLDRGTLVVGDYGGNEHIYYYHEYRDMLRRAGFRHVRDRVMRRYHRPENYLAILRSQGNGRLKLLVRQAYYAGVRGLFRLGVFASPFLALMKRLSLLQTDFVATKDERSGERERTAEPERGLAA
jgi:SAM-dependent methyltransferase